MKNMLVSLMEFALLCAPLTVHAGPSAAVSAEDRQQILDLVSVYSYTYDGKDIEGYLALFTQDCIWEWYAAGGSAPLVRAVNRDELRTLTAQRLSMLQQKGIQTRHYQTNTMLALRADGQVDGTTLVNLMWQVPGEKPYTVMTGIYRDVFVKTEGGWKIARRSFLMDQSEVRK